jgi:hypothetical protein
MEELSMDRNLGIALLFTLFFNVLLFLSQTSVDAIAYEEGAIAPVFFTYEGSLISKYDAGNKTLSSDVASQLPESTGEVKADAGTGFWTDLFSTIKGWILSIPGTKILYGLVTAVPNFLYAMNLPTSVAFSLGAIWYIWSLTLIIMLLVGR